MVFPCDSRGVNFWGYKRVRGRWIFDSRVVLVGEVPIKQENYA